MIERIIEGSLRNRGMVIALYLLIVVWGIWAVKNMPVDAIPNIGENQVIVFADWPGRSPQDIEDQVVYPLTISLMGLPRVKVVRSNSYFGFGLVSIIFEDNVDFYWARTRTLERLDEAQQSLPEGATVGLGPDATALGQIFWYTLENGYYCPDHPTVSYAQDGVCPQDGLPLERSDYDLGELRSLQDWYIRYQLSSVKGVAEVASVGGYVKQYQIDVHPDRLLAYKVKLSDIIMAVKRSNLDVGAKTFEEGGTEFVVRGVGFIRSVEDIENTVIGASEGIPTFVKNVANVTIGPDFRRGALDKEGVEVTGGVVLMQYGENPLKIIGKVKTKIGELGPGLPPGVRIVPFYDRTLLIKRSISTLTFSLILATVITILTIVAFLRHFFGSLIISIILPVGVLMAFVVMKYIGVDANIMSLGGIIIAIGVMVDSGIVMTENIYRRLTEAHLEKGSPLTSNERLETSVAGAKEVATPVLFSLLTTIVSFIPVFALTGKSGRLFHPLAFTKTFAMLGAAVISLTLIPALSYFLLKGRLRSVDESILSRQIRKAYRPIIRWSLDHKLVPAIAAIVVLAIGLAMFPNIKREFMPPLNEGDLLFMPVLMPGASITQVMDVMKRQDTVIKRQFPDEVEMVVGKLGRAETATDPAPVTMLETVIKLKDRKYWRKGMTREKLVREIVEASRVPGVSPIMTQPIQNRIDMLATGIQTPVGIKVFGDSLGKVVEIALQIEGILRDIPGAVGPYAERADRRPYFEIDIDRPKAARYGIKVGDVQDVIMTGIGGMNIGTIVEGRRRFPIRVRYARELRDNVESLKRVLVPTSSGAQVPLSQVALLKKEPGPVMIGTENGLPYARVFVNVDQAKVGLVDFVNKASKVVEKTIVEQGKLPPGYYIAWSGQYEAELEARKKLVVAVPVALLVILLLLYTVFRSASSTVVVATGLPISLMGGVILLFLLGFKMSIAVWVGFIALFGVATDNAVVLVSTLDDLFRRKASTTVGEIREMVIKGGMLRVRPSVMTTMTTILALIPVMLSRGTGSEIMKPMASPTIGGLITATLSNLILVPVVYAWMKERALKRVKGGNS
jgi:Cu(I)/Ag(I) efflux system membrane protein CusA/SilA